MAPESQPENAAKSRKCCSVMSRLLNIDVVVYIAMLRTVTDGKERKLLLS